MSKDSSPKFYQNNKQRLVEYIKKHYKMRRNALLQL